MLSAERIDGRTCVLAILTMSECIFAKGACDVVMTQRPVNGHLTPGGRSRPRR